MEQAKTGSLGELRDECKRTRAASDPDPEATQRRIHANRAARRHSEVDGSDVLTLRGTPDAIGRMITAAQHHADRFFRAARREGRREPAEAYLFDAFEDLITRPSDSEDRSPLPTGANAKIIFRIDYDVCGPPISGPSYVRVFDQVRGLV